MKIKAFFLILFLSFSSLSSFAQTPMKEAEEKVMIALKKLRSNAEDIDREKAAIEFKRLLKSLLLKEESWTYTFPELQKQINMKSTKDGNIKTFSWDSLLGGSWHALQNLIQFKSGEKIHVVSLSDKKAIGEEEGNDMFADAAIVNIYVFEKGYLFEGFGTYGSGHHHKVLAYYELENKELVRKSVFENNQDMYVFKIPRRYEFDLEVDVKKKNITHSEFVLDDDIGFFQPTGKKVMLSFDGKQFVKQVKP